MIQNLSNNELIALYQEAVVAYYQTDEAIMSDEEFDSIKDELESRGIFMLEVEAENVREKLSTENNMLSLKKVQVFSDHMEQKHIDSVLQHLRMYDPTVSEDTEVMVGWKLDGCAISLRFNENYELVDVVTRGNFSIAKKFLELAKKQQGIYKESNSTFELRCEAVIPKDRFLEKYLETYANPRNLVSGILNDTDVNDPRARDIDFVAYNDGVNAWDNLSETYQQVHYHYCKISELPKYFEGFKSKRSSFNYQTDGLVVYLPGVKELKTFGKYPLHSLAIKFPPVKVQTRVKRIEWNLKKSGEWIPKAILEPVDLDGSRVTKSLVFNHGYVIDNKIAPGALVEVAKNGDIIPYIQRVIQPGNMDELQIPEGVIVGKHLIADESSEKVAEERFIAGCYTLSIKDFGYAWFKGCALLCKNSIIELFNPDVINEKSLQKLFGGEKKVKSFIKEISKIRDSGITVYQLLRLLQIPGLGSQTAHQVARKLSGLDYNYSGLEKAPIESVEHGTYSDIIFNHINNSYINILPIEEDKTEYTATYEMTGSPKEFGFKTKQEFQKSIPTWKHTKLDASTSYLITDDLSSTSSKMAKATKLGVQIITYSQAVELFNKKVC